MLDTENSTLWLVFKVCFVLNLMILYVAMFNYFAATLIWITDSLKWLQMYCNKQHKYNMAKYYYTQQ